MDIHELRRVPHLSASSVTSYIECSLAYKFERIDRLESDGVSDALILGQAVHRALADFYQAQLIGQSFDLDDLHFSFDNHWFDLIGRHDDIEYKPGANAETVNQLGQDLLALYYENISEDGCRILAIEEPFTCQLPDLPAPFIGVHDLVLEDEDGVIIIVDHKTAARSYSTSQIDQNFQMTAYQIAARANGFADREILLRLDCLIKTKQPKFEQYWTSRSEADERMAVRKIQAVWDGISKGVFLPNDTSWKCGYCGYQDACREWLQGLRN